MGWLVQNGWGKEITGWGWNALSVSLVVTLASTLLESIGLIYQDRTVYRTERAESLPPSLFAYNACYFAGLIVYGIHIQSVALLVNGLVETPIYLHLVWGIRRFKGFRVGDRWVTIASIILLMALVVTPWREAVFLLFSVGTLVVVCQLPRELWRHGRGVVRGVLPFVYTVSQFFWFVHAVTFGDLALSVVTGVGFAVLLVALLIWVFLPRGKRSLTKKRKRGKVASSTEEVRR